MSLAERDRRAAETGRGRRALEVTVESLRRRHLRGVMAIEQRVYPSPWSASLFAAELDQPDTRRYLVATVPRAVVGGRLPGRAVVGYAGVMVVVGEAHVTTVAVHPHHHRRKVASRLLLGLLRASRAMGAGAATLEVRAANRGAQRLYGAFGFAPVGVRPGYYAETREDAVIMWAHDLQSAAFGARLDTLQARVNRPGGSSGAPDLAVPWVDDRIGLRRGRRGP